MSSTLVLVHNSTLITFSEVLGGPPKRLKRLCWSSNSYIIITLKKIQWPDTTISQQPNILQQNRLYHSVQLKMVSLLI